MDRSETIQPLIAAMNDCLGKLDEIGADLAAAHLAMAIDALKCEANNGSRASPPPFPGEFPPLPS